MKTTLIVIIMIFSGFCTLRPFGCAAQERLICAHSADLYTETPALSCFIPSFAGTRFQNDFGRKELMNAEIVGTYAIGKNYLMSSINHYGYADYGNFQLSVGYGRNFGGHFALSGRIIYIMEHARGYPAHHSLCADFALAGRISPKLFLFATAYNPFLMHYNMVGQEIIPLKFTIGCTYSPLPKLLMSAIMAKNLPGGWEVLGRVMTQPMTSLLLAADCSNHYLGLWIALTYKNFLFSVKAAWYYRISVSPEIGGWYFKR